jgi:CheY-like chemotaxis protein
MNHERILLANSNLKNVALVQSRLESKGFLVSCARTSEDALKQLNTKWIDLIVLDSGIKGKMDGLQLFKAIKNKKKYAQIPIVVQSSKVSMKKTFELQGASAFFINPCSMDLLMEEIRDIVTPKALILGDRSIVSESIVKNLSEYDIQIEMLHNTSKFYFNIICHRYNLVVVQYKMRPNVTDRILTIIRGSAKNEDVPVIVYTATKLSRFDSSGMKKASRMKERCGLLGSCEFIDRGYTTKHFKELVQRHFET